VCWPKDIFYRKKRSRGQAMCVKSLDVISREGEMGGKTSISTIYGGVQSVL